MLSDKGDKINEGWAIKCVSECEGRKIWLEVKTVSGITAEASLG